jgi:glycosyltransferase involved in cell wall biosynthesis
LHVINGEHYSGAERVQDLLACELPKFGYDVGFACLKPGVFAKIRRSQSSNLLNLPMRSRIDWSAARQLVEYFRDGKYDVLHAHTPRSLLIASSAAKTLNCPLLYHVHSPVGRDSKRRFRNWINSLMEMHSLRRVDRMICVSHSLKEYMRELGHAEDRLRVVHNGVPVAAKEVELPPVGAPWTIGMVALFRPRKGTEVLLQSLAIMRREKYPVRLLMVGSFENSEYESEVNRLVEQLGMKSHVTWTGFERDVNSRLREMQLMVLPSLFGEGLPMVVLEAMAVGLPVVASRVEGIPEAIRDDQDGSIFEPGNATDLADKISAIIEQPDHWRRLRDSAWDRQRIALSDTSMAAGVAQVYDELLR